MNSIPKYLRLITLLFLFTLYINGSAQLPKVNIILLGGQSNMAGRGVFENIPQADIERLEKVSNRVQVVSQGNIPQKLSYAKKGKHVNEFGPELYVGLVLAEQFPDKEFLIVKTAVGGTSLHGAWSPSWTKEKALESERGESRQKMKLYSDHINSIKQSLDRLQKEGREYEIVAMGWMQGEKDTRLQLSATSYEQNLKELIVSYREEFNKPNLPFVYGQVNNPARPKDYKGGVELVRAAMENISTEVNNVKMIPTSTDSLWIDYPKHDDNVHYNAEGQKKLGSAMGKLFLELL